MALDAAIPWFLVLFLVLLPLAVIFDHTIWYGTTLALFKVLTRLSKHTRSAFKR